MRTTTPASPSSTRGAPAVSAAGWDRKVSIAISMPYSLVEEIDRLRGDTPRSVFVCKILCAKVTVEGEGGVRKEDGIC
jgi:hypothetical protein